MATPPAAPALAFTPPFSAVAPLTVADCSTSRLPMTVRSPVQMVLGAFDVTLSAVMVAVPPGRVAVNACASWSYCTTAPSG
ncbi:hypothetical protein D3C81_2095790 [compost metagenome]